MPTIKDVPGYEGLYQISDNGEIISLYFGKRKIIKPSLMKGGYLFYPFKKDKKAFNFSVHRVVAITFIDNPDNLKEVNHKDGNKQNNNVSNLEWVTRNQNMQHSYDTGLRKYRPCHYKGKFGSEHNRSKKVICINTGEVYGSMSEASRKLKISISSVSGSVNNGLSVFGNQFKLAQ